jgi:hypothetical protein
MMSCTSTNPARLALPPRSKRPHSSTASRLPSSGCSTPTSWPPSSSRCWWPIYRYYFYQHRLEDALLVAERALDVSARRLHLTGSWSNLGPITLGEAAMRSMGMLRFHLLALKGSAVILLRLGRLNEARARLKKIAEVDTRDALGVLPLLSVIDRQYAPAHELLD